MVNLADRARAWFWRRHPHRRRREQELRAHYQALLDERHRSLEERVQFHLHHLALYWSRCLGFLDLQPIHGAAFVAGDLAACIYIASEAAGADVRAYIAAHAATELGIAWEQYARSLGSMSRADPSVTVAVRRSADAFRRVRAAQGPILSA